MPNNKKKIFTEKQKEEIIYKYTVEKIGAKKLGQIYGCSAPTLLKNLSEWGVPTNTKKLNLTNQVFGDLTVIKPAPSRNDKYTRWICKCSCGNEIEVRTDYLTSKHTTSCGHKKDQFFKQKDLIGQRFGKLIVINNLQGGKKECQCDCGNITIVETYNLINGNTQSCGCLKSKGELKINEILTELGVNFKTQYYFDDCRFTDTNRLAYFDYAILKNDKVVLLIEYDGMQHETGWMHNTESLKDIQKRDNFKNSYCLYKKIPLIRISYKDYDNFNLAYFQNLLKEVEYVQEVI